MGYLHIENLYKNQEILLFKECYALEKIHGTSAHIKWHEGKLTFFSGGEKHTNFVKLFPDNYAETLKECPDFIIYGEAYGGKQQGMSATYGKELKFIAFDVVIHDCWLSVPQAEDFCKSRGIEFVHYVKVPTDVDSLNAQRDADSEQAIRNGIGPGKKREGVVLRPLMEFTKNNKERVISKHKRDEFKETKTSRDLDPAKLQVLTEANAIADEWVTVMRLKHVLDKMPGHAIEKMPDIIKNMVEDVVREGSKEIVDNETVRKAIGKKTAIMYKQLLQEALTNA